VQVPQCPKTVNWLLAQSSNTAETRNHNHLLGWPSSKCIASLKKRGKAGVDFASV
jgi:hypothetical protein